MPGAIIEGKDIHASVREDVDVCIIGSGAGGAVMAKELAQKGARVIVLEEGGFYNKDNYPKTIRECFLKLYRNHGMDTTMGIPAIIVPTGKCLGGTTVINMGTCFRLPSSTHKKWEEMGVAGWSETDLSPYYDQVEKIMSVREIQPDVMGKNGEIIAEGARRMGLHPRPLKHNINEHCKGCGNCSYGCHEDAKQAMTLNYIPQAVNLGAKFFCDSKGEFILNDEKRVMGVRGSVRDRETGIFRHHIEIAADTDHPGRGRAQHAGHPAEKRNLQRERPGGQKPQAAFVRPRDQASLTRSLTATMEWASACRWMTSRNWASCSRPLSPGRPASCPGSRVSARSFGTWPRISERWPAWE